MNKKYVFAKTAKGARALQKCETLLPQNECRVLALVNGSFTLEDIQVRLTLITDMEFRKTVALLEKEGYIHRQVKDDALDGPLSVMSVVEMDVEQGVQEWAAANRAAEALHQNGYYLTQHERGKGLGPEQILIIDDEKSIAEIVATVLGGVGYAVEWIEDPRRAIDKIRAMPNLVLVLLDVVMPHQNGFEVLRQIRAQPSLHKLPVVMLTAHANPEHVAEGLRYGADGYILKPFKPEKLIRYLLDTLKER